MTTDHRDLVIEALAADEAAALRHIAEVAEVQAERDSYRELLHVALTQLHEQEATIERLRTMRDRETHRRLREEILVAEKEAA